MPLQLNPNFYRTGQRVFRDYSAGDEFYQMLVDANHGMTDEQSAMFNARLVLLLANHVGDLDVLREAITLAKDAG